jgi:hypothetical protein
VWTTRALTEAFVANARLQIRRHRKDEAKAEDQRLQPGDIVATSPGFVVFVGRDSEERQLGDFLPAPSGVSTADAPTQSRTLGRLRHFTKIRPPARSHWVDPVKKILCI